jgi:hypothetical protein
MQAEHGHEQQQGPMDVSAADSAEPEGSSTEPSPVFRQARRSASRALALPAEPEWTLASLRRGGERLAELALQHGLSPLEPALLTLLCDPFRTQRKDWRWQLLQPVRGLAHAADLGADASLGWTFSGACLETECQGGLPALRRLYAFAFGEYLPRFKHRLAQPCIYHRVLAGLEGADPAGLRMALSFPVVLTIAPQS